jgi:eukaryotic-like serine/threonine-protein kinase
VTPVNAEPLDRFERLFRAGRLHPPADRASFLEAACSDDPALRAELLGLLAADAEAEGEAFLDVPAPVLARGVSGGSARAVSTEQLLGKEIGPYTVLRQLGEGGMGAVYLALRQAPFKRYVALKVIREGATSNDARQRFEVERQILASLDHPSIARLLDGGVTEDGRPYFAMEYVDGLPLTRYADEHRLGLGERLRLFQTVCAAVHYAHQNLVLHRDLKPSNILVTAEGHVKLLDFGIAKLLNPLLSPVSPVMTRTEFRVMTPEYASPEQVRGEPLSTASDVYALGVLLYELLTGGRPHRLAGRSTHEIIQILSREEPRRPSLVVTPAVAPPHEDADQATPAARAYARATSPERLQRRLAGDLDTICLHALRKEPNRRYTSAEQLGEDVERHLRGQPVLAHRDSRSYRLGKFVLRHKAETASGMVVALLLIGFALFSSWQAHAVAAERDRAEAEHAKAEEVARFLEGLFAAADPYAPVPQRLDTLQVREFLARGAERLRTELAAQPLIQARMLDIIGRVHRSLGLYAEARPLLEQALENRRAALGPQHPDVAESQTSLAILLLHTGEYDLAQSLLEGALAINARVWGGEHPSIAVDLNHLAAVLRERGLYEDAERRHMEAIEMLQKTGRGDPRLAEFMTNLVATLEWEGDYQAAEHYARESIVLHRMFYGNTHPQFALAVRELGLIVQRRGAYREAEAFFREALGIAEATLGWEHPQTADLLNRLGSVRRWQKDLAAADSLHRRSLEIKRRLYGGEHIEVAYGLNNLASVLRDRGAFAAADSMHREALAVTRAVVGEEHSAYWILLGNLGLTLAVAGDCPQAEWLLRESTGGLRRTIPQERIRVALNQRALGGCLTQVGRFGDAEVELLASYGTFREERGVSAPFTRETAEHLIALYTAWGKPEQAAQYQWPTPSGRQ